jgi:hypothetical protein
LADHSQPSHITLTIFLSIITILSLASLLFVVSIVYVHWSTEEELRRPDLGSLARHLVEIRNRRTFRYRLAFAIHFAVILLAFVMILLREFEIM